MDFVYRRHLILFISKSIGIFNVEKNNNSKKELNEKNNFNVCYKSFAFL
jgi:hypothetical protein